MVILAFSILDMDINFGKDDLHSKHYHLVSCDLRHTEEFELKLRESDCDFTLPTIFIAECVLVYMPFSHSNNLLAWIAEKFLAIFFVNYEQVSDGRILKNMEYILCMTYM